MKRVLMRFESQNPGTSCTFRGHFLATLASFALLATPPLLITACTKEAPVEILSPALGAMLPGGQAVAVQVKSGGRVRVNGTEVGGSGTREVSVDPADGLGFIVAEKPGDPLVAVRSFHQGSYLSTSDFHAGTMGVSLGSELLAGGDPTVASLTSTLLEDAELEEYVEEPITMTVNVGIPVTVNIFVDSVVSPEVAVDLWLEGGALRFDALLRNTDVDYRAQATSLSSSGTARYAEIHVTGTVTLTTSSVTLEGVLVTHSDPVITDSGGLPSGAVTTLATTLNAKVPQAVAAAAQNVAEDVFTLLVTHLRPQVGVTFERPLVQEARPATLLQDGSGIHLSYETRIQAASPEVAGAEQGVLARTDSDESADGTGLGARIGRALVNQLAFAAWDAGNFAGISFTQAELEALGMEPLDFPYSRLQSTTLSLLLPPLLEWDTAGPWLDLGEIQILLVVGGHPDTTAYTAARVPVRLAQIAGAPHQLRLEVDPERTVVLREVGFDKMSELVSLSKVHRLLGSAVPGVVDAVFGDLPAVELAPMSLERLDGTPGPVIQPTITAVTLGIDSWRLRLSLGI